MSREHESSSRPAPLAAPPPRDGTPELRAETARLEPVPDLAYARHILERYSPPDPDQAAMRARILAFLDEHPADAHLRTCLAGHLTASALLVDRAGGRALLTFHRKLGRWLQLGGHCDGDANLMGVAWRETVEESGIVPASITAVPVDVDVHAIPARPGEPEHVHLDTRYIVYVGSGARERISAESLELGWFTPRAARGLELDPSLQRLFALAFGAAWSG